MWLAMIAELIPSQALPARRGSRPQTLPGPLHLQFNQHGDRKYLEQLLDRVLSWPHVEPAPSMADSPDTIFVRLKQTAATSEPSVFITDREFGRLLLGAPTIYLALPLVCAHWAILRRWAEPHYLASYGLMPAGTVVVYTPRDPAELEVCTFFFEESYRFVSRSVDGSRERLRAATQDDRNGLPMEANRRE